MSKENRAAILITMGSVLFTAAFLYFFYVWPEKIGPEQKEHGYFNRQEPTPWVKVNVVAEHVFFNHQRHINSQVACEECHGEVKHLQRLPEKQWRMGQCLECHHRKKASVDCWLTCHN